MSKSTDDWRGVIVPPSTPLIDGMKVIEEHRLKICLVAEEDHRLLGTLTDGDVRRAILDGNAMTTPVSEVMNENPRTEWLTTPIAEQIQQMRALKLPLLVITDDQNQIVGVSHLESLTAKTEPFENPVVLMAGGFGRRLRPLTETTPKPLLKVGDRPILETIIRNFVAQNFRRFFISVNYKARQIMDYFGDGSPWGAEITYLTEDQKLGTAGPLRLMEGRTELPMVVMNGDLLTKVNFRHLLQYHQEHNCDATMCVREYSIQVPYGVVQLSDNHIQGIDEKPDHKFFVNAGIYVINPDMISLIPTSAQFDMPPLFENIISKGKKVAAFPLHEYWRDVGHVDQLNQANDEFSGEFIS